MTNGSQMIINGREKKVKNKQENFILRHSMWCGGKIFLCTFGDKCILGSELRWHH